MVTTPQKKVLATGPSGPAIRDFPTEERPRERLRTHGAGNLSNSELMAILLRTGLEGENVVAMSVRLLATVDGLLNSVADCNARLAVMLVSPQNPSILSNREQGTTCRRHKTGIY